MMAELRWQLHRTRTAGDNMLRRLAWKLPRRLVMWCGYRILANATMGVHGDTAAPALLAMDAMKRWGN